MKKSSIAILAFIIFAVTPSCKKEKKENLNPIKIIKSQALANNTNSLQSYYSKEGDTTQVFFYGDFDAKGEPQNIKSIIFQMNNGASTLTMFFDDLHRVTSYYITKLGVKEPFLFSFEYPDQKSTVGKLYSYNFDTDESKLLSQKTFDTETGQVIGSLLKKPNPNYAGIGMPILALLALQNNSTPDKFSSEQFLIVAVALAAVVIAPVLVGIIVNNVAVAASISGGAAKLLGTIAGTAALIKVLSFFKDSKAIEIGQPEIINPPAPNPPSINNWCTITYLILTPRTGWVSFSSYGGGNAVKVSDLQGEYKNFGGNITTGLIGWVYRIKKGTTYGIVQYDLGAEGYGQSNDRGMIGPYECK